MLYVCRCFAYFLFMILLILRDRHNYNCGSDIILQMFYGESLFHYIQYDFVTGTNKRKTTCQYGCLELLIRTKCAVSGLRWHSCHNNSQRTKVNLQPLRAPSDAPFARL